MSLTPYFVICGLVCAFWMLVHHFLASRLDAYKLLMSLMGSVFLAAAGDVLLGSLTGSDTVSHLVELSCSPCIIPLTWLYFTKLERPFKPGPFHYVWLLFPVALLTCCWIESIPASRCSPTIPMWDWRRPITYGRY